ncbi:MAG TPA: GNAT family N-acetyltransferase [Tepidisphaeraceae bacterium]|nr:GNAT family N-acetyltransferase [Tepidisphaeraceae bacterium]
MIASRDVEKIMQYSIRPMLESDIPNALDLWRRTPGLGLNESDTPARLAAYLLRNPGQSFVARDAGGTLLGAVLGGNDGRRGYLQHLAVEPAARGKGIGSGLVQRCIEALAALDIYKCNVFVFMTNTAGREFWQKHGWKLRHDLCTMQTLTGTAE